jgi:hypothetical protein
MRVPIARTVEAAVSAASTKLAGDTPVATGAFLFLLLFFTSCATQKDVQHRVVISVKDQRLALLDRETLVAIYPVSTSKYGVGDWRGSYRTPLGQLEVAQKFGDGMRSGTVLNDRR